MSDETTASSSSQKGNLFDPKKLGQLEEARRAMSMDAEHTRSRRWQVATPLGGRRSIILNSQVSASTLDLGSLRSLGSSPTKRNTETLSVSTSDKDVKRTENETRDFSLNCLHRPAVTEATFRQGEKSKAPMRHCGPPDFSCLYPDLHGPPDKESGPESAQSFAPESARFVERPSICQGVDEKTIAALSELAQRGRKDTPPILLPSNRPFLVGENANLLVSESQVQKPMVKQRADYSPKEALNITVLSKLLFFGGMAPQGVSQSNQVDDAVPSPDVTMVSQSDSCDYDNAKHSYLLQLGHIMGEVSPRPSATQTRTTEFDETASTISSLEHPLVAPDDAVMPPHRRRIYWRFLLFVVIALAASKTSHDHAFQTVVERTKLAMRQRVGELTFGACSTVCAKTLDLADIYFDKEQALIKLNEWKNITMYFYAKAMHLIMEPADPQYQIIQRYQCTALDLWTRPVAISTAVMIAMESGPLQARLLQPRHSNVPPPSPNETFVAVSQVLEDTGGDASVLTDPEPVVERAATSLQDVGFPILDHDERPVDAWKLRDRITVTDRVRAKSMSKLRESGEVVSMRLQRTRLEIVAQNSGMSVPFAGSALDRVPSGNLLMKSTSNFWDRMEAAFLALNLGVLNIQNTRGHRRALSDDSFSCVLSQAVMSSCQCSPLIGSQTICCAPLLFDAHDHVAPFDSTKEPRRLKDDDDEFLQKPLFDVVVDFFRERRKRRERRRRERHRKRQPA